MNFVNGFLGANLLAATFLFAIQGSLGKFWYQNSLEAQFVAENDALLAVTAKYNFGIFDFHQAKKESHLKAVKTKLLEDSKFGLLD